MSDIFFIVGNSRSGTTLISRILKNHPEIYVLNETHFFEEFSSEMETFSDLSEKQLYRLVNRMLTIQRKDYYRKAEYEEYPEESLNILCDYEKVGSGDFASLNKAFFLYEASRQSKKKAGDQTPRHVFYVDDIFAMYSQAKVIHMVRDPRAVLFSQKKKWASGLRRKQPLFEVIRTLMNYHPITMSVLWSKAVTAGMIAQKKYGDNKIKTVFFENFVNMPAETTQDVCRFLDAEFFPDMLDVSVELSATTEQEGQKGVARSVADQWKKGFSKTEIYLCEKYAGDLMEDLGFQLAGVKPSRLKLAMFYAWFPAHLFIALVLNLSRMGNPFTYISKRLFNSNTRI